jgi:hypothetical protein
VTFVIKAAEAGTESAPREAEGDKQPKRQFGGADPWRDQTPTDRKGNIFQTLRHGPILHAE